MPLHSRFYLSWFVLSLIAGNLAALHAAAPGNPILVASLSALKGAISRAEPGDTILLKDGVYTTSSQITVKRGGAAGKPVTIAAEHDGGAEIAGSSGFTISEPAEHVVIYGFKLTHAAGKNTVAAGTQHVRFTRNTFRCAGDGSYLSISGDDVQIDYNDFAEKNTAGAMVAIGGTGGQVARRVWIHHNYFHDLTSGVATPAEMIRFGLSNSALSTGKGVVEHNLFARCRGESELISNRSSGNIYRYNTFLDSPTAKFSLRHGNDCEVYGNIFKNTEGLRLFGDRHQVYSNYFEGNYIGINLGNGSVDVSAGGATNGMDRPDDCIIVFNTFVDNRTHYQMSRRTVDPLGARNITVANNVFSGGGVAARIEGPYQGAVWSGNLVWTKAGAGDIPANGFTAKDPRLEPGPGGLKRPPPGAAATDSAVGSFPMVKTDIDGQPRGAQPNLGADELSNEPVSATLLSPADVGPGSKSRGRTSTGRAP